jgi:cell wall-associated NlpC family hydrolase
VKRWPLAAFAVAALLLVPTAAHADRISDKRAEAARVEMQIHRFDARLEATVDEYNQAVSHLGDVRREIRENRRLLAIARHNLAVARDQLAEMMVGAYKDGENDLLLYVLGAGSFTELLSRIDTTRRVGGAQTNLLETIARTEREVERRRAQLRHDERRAERLVAERAAKRRQIKAALAERERLLDSINAEVQRLIRERQEARERAARQAAAEAAREAAAAAAAAAEQETTAPSPTPSPAPAPPPAGSLGQQAVQVAMQFLGVPYVWGGASPSGFDCSGLTMYAYAQVGISLPHFTGAQWTAGPHVSSDQLAPGDLVFFTPSLGHMGMYIGGGSFIHAPRTGDVVKISSLSDPWYVSQYQGAVRVTG